MTDFSHNNLLITGGEHSDRKAYAIKRIQSLLCPRRRDDDPCNACNNCQRVSTNTHPNLIVIESKSSDADDTISNKESVDNVGIIKIEQIRKVILDHQKTNFEKGRAIFLISSMHKITKAAANALLKALEESKSGKTFIALAPSRKSILPTLASRFIAHPIKPPKLINSRNDVLEQQIMTISKTKPSSRFPLCAQFGTDRDELLSKLDELSTQCHLLLREKVIMPRSALLILEALQKAEQSVRRNLNTRLVTENLILREWPYLNP